MRHLVDRLSARLHVVPGGCWEWQGYHNLEGYGRIWVNNSNVRVHRAMWEIVFGPIPDGMKILHTCDNPPCANPGHLFLGTIAENNADRNAKGRSANNKGEKNGNAKLTQKQVDIIRADDRLGAVLAVEYGVHKNTINDIKRGYSWAETV